MKTAKKLKDWLDGDCATHLGRAIKANHSVFNIESFAVAVDQGVGPLELKDRIALMSDALRVRLPDDYKEAAVIIAASHCPPLEGNVGMLASGYRLMPVA